MLNRKYHLWNNLKKIFEIKSNELRSLFKYKVKKNYCRSNRKSFELFNFNAEVISPNTVFKADKLDELVFDLNQC